MFTGADLPTLEQGYEAATFLYGQRHALGLEPIAPVLSVLSGDLMREIGTRTDHAPASPPAGHEPVIKPGTFKRRDGTPIEPPLEPGDYPAAAECHLCGTPLHKATFLNTWTHDDQ